MLYNHAVMCIFVRIKFGRNVMFKLETVEVSQLLFVQFAQTPALY